MKFLHCLCFVLVSVLLCASFPGTSAAAAGQRDQDGYILGGYGDRDPNIFRPSKMDGRAARVKDSKGVRAKDGKAGAKPPVKAN